MYFLLIIDNFITNFYNYDTRAEDIMGLHPGLVLGIPLERVVIIISLASEARLSLVLAIISTR